VRQIRGEMNISPVRPIPVLLRGAGITDRAHVERHRVYLERLAGLASLTVLGNDEQPPHSATALAGELTVLVPMAGLIDAAAEAERLAKRIGKTQQDLAKTRAKLANEHFATHAPPAVVNAEREREAELERAVAGLTSQLERVRTLLTS